jgi:hypothetical protein
MSATQQNDTHKAFTKEGVQGMIRVMPEGMFKVENVKSFDAFKTKNIDFSSLRPAILVGQNLIIQTQSVRL